MSLQAPSVEKVNKQNFVYVNANFQKIFKKLVDCVVCDRGCVLLIGASGVGKTLMLHRVIDIMGGMIRPLYVDKAYVDFNGLTTDIGQALGLDVKPGQELAALESFFVSSKSSVQPTAFFIDNVEKYDEKTFVQLLSLIEIFSHNKNAPSVILAGRPELLKRFNDFRGSQFRKNLVNHYCEMHPLPNKEIESYLNRRLQHKGFGAKILLSEAAVSKLIRYSEGIPGTINRLCDEAISTLPEVGVGEITDMLIEEIASHELTPLADKGVGIVIPLEESSSQQNEEENHQEPGLDETITDDHSGKIASYEKSVKEDSVQMPSSNGENAAFEEPSAPETQQSTDLTEAAIESDTKKLEDVLASVYVSKRFVPSSAIKSQSAIQPSVAEIDEADRVFADRGDARQDEAEGHEDSRLFEEQVGKGEQQGYVPHILELADEDSGEHFPLKGEVIHIGPIEKTGFLNGVLWLLAALVLFVAVGFLGYQFVKNKESESEGLVDSRTSGESIESKSIENKQSSVSRVQADSIQPSIVLPVTGDTGLPKSAEGRDQILTGMNFKSDDKSVEGLFPSARGENPDFATETELLRMSLLEKNKGNDGFQRSILINASKKGYTKAVDQLLEFGYDINYQGEYGDTALIWAVVNGHLDTVQVLLEHGADFSIINKLGVTAMSSAIHAGNIPIIETLLNAGANPHSTDEKNRTTLMVAVAQEKGNKELVERLLMLGVNVDAVGQNGRTALMNAAEKGNEEFVRILLENHADIAITEKNGDSALDIANKAGFTRLAKLLDVPD